MKQITKKKGIEMIKKQLKEGDKMFIVPKVHKSKLKTRPCGMCGEEDTMLVCMECMRRVIENKKKSEVEKDYPRSPR